MQKTIFISGIISEFPFRDSEGNEEQTYSVTNLVSAVKQAREEGATSFAFHIDSDGGSVEEGFRMARYIESLPEPTTGIAQRVFSIANVVYFACDERRTDTRATWMLHNAWLMNISGNSKELREYADDLERTSNRMANYISYRTGLEVSALKALMDTDRMISEAEARDLGFLNSYKPIQAVAVSIKKKSNQKSTINMAGIKEEFQNWAKSLGFKVSPMALAMETKDGQMMEIQTENEGELVGKSCNMEDGEYAMKDGKHITVVAGKVESVKGMEDMEDGKDDEEKEQMRAEIQSLQAQLQEAQALKREKEDAYKAQASEIEEVRKQMDALAKMVQTNRSAPAPNKPFSQTKAAPRAEDMPEKLKGMSHNQIMYAWQSGEVTKEEAEKAFLLLG